MAHDWWSWVTVRGLGWPFSSAEPSLPSGWWVLPFGEWHWARRGCRARLWLPPSRGVTRLREARPQHRREDCLAQVSSNSDNAVLFLPLPPPPPVCFRTWRRESAGGCFCERPPPPRRRSPKDRGACPPRGQAVRHLQAAPCQPWLCQQNTWQVRVGDKSLVSIKRKKHP